MKTRRLAWLCGVMVLGCDAPAGGVDGGVGGASGGSVGGGGGSVGGGSVGGGSVGGGSVGGGSVGGGSVGGGSIGGGSVGGGSVGGGSTSGGSAGGSSGGRAGGSAGGSTSGGSAGGSASGGTAGGSRAGGSAGGSTSGGSAGGSTSGGTAGGSRAGGSAGGASGQTGLEWPLNGVAGSDARLVWSGTNLLPRCPHTAIWKARYIHTAGYYAVAWHTSNDGTWHASDYEFGTHPYPTTGTVNTDGQSTGGTGSAGLVQYYEIAGLGASDFIASPGPGPTYLVVKGIWVTQARTCEIINNGTSIRHRYWPDITSPSGFIEQTISKTRLDQAVPLSVSPSFIIGSSPWTGGGGANSESPNAVLRGFAFFNAVLSIGDIVAEAATDQNTPATAAGTASVWYINKNPTVTDVSDKSGAGHSPTWANSQRPRPFP